MLARDCNFNCPHCNAFIMTKIIAFGGIDQRFIQACEACQEPIQVDVRIEGEEIITFSAKAVKR